MPKKNLLAFIVLSALLLTGWWWARFVLFEQPPAKEDPKVAQLDKKDIKPPEKQEAPPPKEEKKEDAKKPAPAPEVIPDETAKDIALGDAKLGNYYVLATLTTRGGGIRKLILPKFQKADENGQPVFNADRTPTPLELIEDDEFIASFLMYHYPDPDPGKDVCVTTLGQRIWSKVSESTTAERSEVALSLDQIPGYPGLRIIKTYTLEPKQYHIGLTVEIHDDRDPRGKDKERLFRYQLAGSHGLPIEGDWYTSIYRTPMIGIINDRGVPRRDLEETQYRIAIKQGGDRIPPDTFDRESIQFGGVATQYFGSLIVVDNKQAEAAAGGVEPKNVVGYCRPTLESREIGGIIESFDATGLKVVLRVKMTKELMEQGVPPTLSFTALQRLAPSLQKRGFKKGDHVFINYYNPNSQTNRPDNNAGDLIATGVRHGNVPHSQFDDFTVRMVSNELKLNPGQKVVHKYLLYHGPAKVELLSQFTGDKAVDPDLVNRYYYDLNLRILTDYRSPGPFGAFASKIMWTDVLILTTRFMHWLLDKLHWLVAWTGGGWGLSIILLTLLVRGAMFPISRRSALLSQRMQALAPEIKKVQEKYKNDPQAKTAAVMELYRKQGVNPLGSCLPMFMQLPFFLGLYYCLQESIHFRLAPFLWMDNLAAPDMLFRWGDGIPIISDPDNMTGSFFSFLYLGPYFNLLPVIAVTLMLVQQKLMTPPPADEQQEMQQKMMKYMFIFIGVMFYKVAAGLCVYFIVSSLWGLAERKMLPKKTATPTEGAAPVGGNGAPAVSKPVRGRGKPEKREKKPETAIQKVKDWWAEVLKQAQKK